ncbi:MAG: HAMP domain-containing histidine kinase [Verrucomicrobiaceae bacterium]|nr:MAG: HAMP domain-containing histidine kinase [Verrucomicrobiaceae bacterium]
MWRIVAGLPNPPECVHGASKNRTSLREYSATDADPAAYGHPITFDPPPSAPSLLLRWTLRLRWVAAFGQLTAMLVAGLVFRLEMPWGPMIGGLVVTLLSNHLLQDSMDETAGKSARSLRLLISGDTLILTWMLYFSGGLFNPFAGFYLLLIALGAMTLSGKSLCALLVLTTAEAVFLGLWNTPFKGPDEVVSAGRLVYPVFLLGWGVSLSLIAVCLAFFVHRMNRQLREREAALAEAGKLVSETSRLQGLATLAAGVAHELGSPLGTIAVASKDLERSLLRQGAAREWQEDARLIRSEVDRCRSILDRLDRQSTRKTGEAPESSTAALICSRLKEHLKPADFSRLRIDDRTRGFPLILSAAAVMQSLVVLIENACEADTAGQPVILDIRIDDGRNIVFRVMDAGPGIPDALRRKIGEPFFTTKKEQSGMGLGIFLVRTLTDHLGGSCSLVPATNGGTCAILSLPVTPLPE